VAEGAGDDGRKEIEARVLEAKVNAAGDSRTYCHMV
jgi:hypothetical protein